MNEEDFRVRNRTYEHSETGARCWYDGVFNIPKGTRIAVEYDLPAYYAIGREVIDDIVEDGVLTEDTWVPTIRDVDSIVTGREPTMESMSKWRIVT